MINTILWTIMYCLGFMIILAVWVLLAPLAMIIFICKGILTYIEILFTALGRYTVYNEEDIDN